jgi:hypothetical protein
MLKETIVAYKPSPKNDAVTISIVDGSDLETEVIREVLAKLNMGSQKNTGFQ